jgi:hypothetical protein
MLKELMDANENLQKAYLLKEEFRDFYRTDFPAFSRATAEPDVCGPAGGTGDEVCSRGSRSSRGMLCWDG